MVVRGEVSGRVALPYRPDVASVLGPFRRGRRDPAMRVVDGWWWRTASTPEGVVTQALRADGAGVISRCWGPAADWQLAHTSQLFGATDQVSPDFAARLDEALPAKSGLPSLSSRVAAWRVPRSLAVWDAVLAAVLEQKVTGLEAHGAWSALLREHGDPAPGPAPEDMRVPPGATRVRRIPSWWWREQGVDRPRSDTIMRLARIGHVLTDLPGRALAEGRTALLTVPGVGPWTWAEVAQRALGDADAVSVGDFHLAGTVVYAFTGSMSGTDEQMLDLLRPFEGERLRVIRALELAGVSRPRRGPRMMIPRHRRG